MTRTKRLALPLLLVGCVASTLQTGCTVYSDKQPPTLATTTSAEQVQRIFWQSVAQGKWIQANALLAPTAVWRVAGRVIPRDQIIPWLKSTGAKAAQVTDVTIQPAVNDMNLVYTLQLQGAHASGGETGCGNQPQTWSALAVWQQPQPSPTAAKKNDKQYSGYLLTVHDLTPAANRACR